MPKSQRRYCQESILASCRIQLQLSYRLLHNQPSHGYTEKALLFLNFYSLPTYFLTKDRGGNLRSGLPHNNAALFFFFNMFFMDCFQPQGEKMPTSSVRVNICIQFHSKAKWEPACPNACWDFPHWHTDNAFSNNVLWNVSFHCKK